jgi:hypothetical protein
MLYLASDQLMVPPDRGDLPSFIESAGYILGAASSCSDIERARIFVATERINEIVEASAIGKAAARQCDSAFRDGMAAGAKAIGSGELDRAQAGAALAVLERMIGR